MIHRRMNSDLLSKYEKTNYTNSIGFLDVSFLDLQALKFILNLRPRKRLIDGLKLTIRYEKAILLNEHKSMNIHPKN